MCLGCHDYYCRYHNWLHCIRDQRESVCEGCRASCPLCYRPRPENQILCEECDRTGCARCHPDQSIGNKYFVCQHCIYRYGCPLSVAAHAEILARDRFGAKTLCQCHIRRNECDRLNDDQYHPGIRVYLKYRVLERVDRGKQTSTLFEIHRIPLNIEIEGQELVNLNGRYPITSCEYFFMKDGEYTGKNQGTEYQLCEVQLVSEEIAKTLFTGSIDFIDEGYNSEYESDHGYYSD